MHESRPSPFIKICCIANVREAELAMQMGADAIGLVSHMPSGPGVISDDLAAEIAKHAANHAAKHGIQTGNRSFKTFLLTSRQTAQAIAAQHAACNTTTLQLVDELTLKELQLLRQLLPSVELVQVIHVLDEGSVQQALAVAPWVDMLLLDSGNPTLAVKQLGGTGRTHNWQLSQRIVAASPVPVLLAGGLNADNARLGLQSVAPYGLDICSGVRSQGALDALKLAVFMRAVKA